MGGSTGCRDKVHFQLRSCENLSRYFTSVEFQTPLRRMIRLEGEPRTEEFTFTLGQLEKLCDLISAVNREQTYWVRRSSAWWDMISPTSHSFAYSYVKQFTATESACHIPLWTTLSVCPSASLSIYLFIYPVSDFHSSSFICTFAVSLRKEPWAECTAQLQRACQACVASQVSSP